MKKCKNIDAVFVLALMYKYYHHIHHIQQNNINNNTEHNNNNSISSILKVINLILTSYPIELMINGNNYLKQWYKIII